VAPAWQSELYAFRVHAMLSVVRANGEHLLNIGFRKDVLISAIQDQVGKALGGTAIALVKGDQQLPSKSTLHEANLEDADVLTAVVLPQVWKQKQIIMFPDLICGSRYSVPFFMHKGIGESFLADDSGQPLRFCEDTSYHAADHKLLWIDVPERQLSFTTAHLYLDAIVSPLTFTFDTDGNSAGQDAAPSRPETMFCLADHFVQDGNGLPQDWCIRYSTPSSAEKSVTVRRPLVLWGPLQKLLGGGCLRLSSRLGQISIFRALDWAPVQWERLHVRARFFDDLSENSAGCNGHWLGFVSPLGAGAVGVATVDHAHYSCVHGDWDSNPWTPHAVARGTGWHTFELIWEVDKWDDMTLLVKVDGVLLAQRRAVPRRDAAACVCITAEPGSSRSADKAMWGSIEVLHTPFGGGTWDVGVQTLTPSCRRPWRVQTVENGHWLKECQQFREMKAAEVEVLEAALAGPPVCEPALPPEPEPEAITAETSDEEPVSDHTPEPLDEPDVEEDIHQEIQESIEPEKTPEPPRAPHPERPVSQRSRRKVGPRPRTSPVTSWSNSSALAIECWSMPNETQLARMDRVMAHFLSSLRDAGVTLPANVQRVGNCQEVPPHTACYVYCFGTRRLHVSTREAEGGKLLLVVRIGGGFVDFVEFAQKHGSLEHLRLEKRDAEERGKHVVRLSSVLSSRHRRVKEVAS